MRPEADRMELSEFDTFVLRLFDRAGTLEKAKERFARAVVRAAVRREGSSIAAAELLKVHRNTINRYADKRKPRPRKDVAVGRKGI